LVVASPVRLRSHLIIKHVGFHAFSPYPHAYWFLPLNFRPAREQSSFFQVRSCVCFSEVRPFFLPSIEQRALPFPFHIPRCVGFTGSIPSPFDRLRSSLFSPPPPPKRSERQDRSRFFNCAVVPPPFPHDGDRFHVTAPPPLFPPVTVSRAISVFPPFLDL